jgi:hypothetical protein
MRGYTMSSNPPRLFGVLQYSVASSEQPPFRVPQLIAPQQFFPSHFCESVTSSPLHIRHLPRRSFAPRRPASSNGHNPTSRTALMPGKTGPPQFGIDQSFLRVFDFCLDTPRIAARTIGVLPP